MVLGVDEASGGKAVERNFPSLTALRRLDLLGLPKSTDKLRFMCRSRLFIEWRDRGPLPTNKGGALDQGDHWIR
jgi:hypothetical protein